ncbi:hypothetical protein BKA82DRAFT_3967788 [Pisolithus tinctorius]|nr:hypothetical protein BKA82DRAFT_3967788 [Pisolithus tinctorius]
MDPQVALKRRIAALEDENSQLLKKLDKKPYVSSWPAIDITNIPSHRRSDTYLLEGRAIRRLVSLVDRVEDLIAEYDWRGLIVADSNDVDIESIPSSADENRIFRSCLKLIRWCPSVQKLLNADVDSHQLTMIYRQAGFACRFSIHSINLILQLNSGADGARGDDACTLKPIVAMWLMEQRPTLDPVIDSHSKSMRGFHHEVTGRLLCPVDYDWNCASVKAAIREFHPDYLVTAYSWPSFLYRNGEYDSKNPTNGLFCGELLIRAFRCIFTSPSSANVQVGSAERPSESQRNARTNRTRCDVSGLLRMRSLRFALSSCESWRIKDEDFDYEVFYQNIIDYFEHPGSPERQKEIDTLLLLWNRLVFGRRNAASYRPLHAEKLSVALSKPRV